ncbi:type II toxin-antitoxin system VapC family toxin [Phaeodactylibacter xiamenensis]|uniref:type II toxin-antitoxin system VapC family toxin n=1 Tax=Phaeodactylibacter xiamenensis TaxID=1524460 RepID=UPI0024A8C281|nr:type II toxin-antitoxin system VapC family toxin [Phaeodactylibacter xiamenensis]
MNYFFDTNAILIYLRDHVQKDWLDKNYDPLGDDNTAMISVVVLGELESLYLRNNWGRRRIESLRIFLRKFLITDINSRDIIRRYGEIDAFSQGKLKEKRLGDSSRNMGKNDLWIAATASVTKLQIDFFRQGL